MATFEKTNYFVLALLTLALTAASIQVHGNTTSSLRNEQIFNTTSCEDLKFTQVADAVYRYDLTDNALSQSRNTEAKSARVMTNYMMSSALLNLSQICIADALELKEAKAKLMKEREILLSGTSLSKKNVKAHRKLSTQASKEIQAATDQSEALKPAQRRSFAFGISTYAAGGYLTKKTVDKTNALIRSLSSDLKNAGTGSADITQTALKLVKTPWGKQGKELSTLNRLAGGAPKHFSQLGSTGRSLMKYAKKNGVKLDPDATQYANFFSS